MGLWADDKAMTVDLSSCVEVSLIQETLDKSLVSSTMRVDSGKTATYEPSHWSQASSSFQELELCSLQNWFKVHIFVRWAESMKS